MKVIICGGGIIGCSTAYFLAKKGIGAVVVERCDVACAASGKAGGFLARDWGGKGPLGLLATKSFDLHMELSQTFTDCDYREVNTLATEVKAGATVSSSMKEKLPNWIDGGIVSVSTLGTTKTTAQVHPYKLTCKFMKAASELAGAKLHIGTVEDVIVKDGVASAVKVNGELMAADVVVITMGPWSGQAKKWFPSLPAVYGDPAHSVVLRPKEQITTAHCVFGEFIQQNLDVGSPEFYPRPDGTVYVCGSYRKEDKNLPVDPKEIKSTEQVRDLLHKLAGDVSSHLTVAEVVKYDRCFLPCIAGSKPMIGRVQNVKGVFIATGHTCWGILNAPATGLCIAELIVDGSCSFLDISAFDPANFK